jgi:hypothetical protein
MTIPSERSRAIGHAHQFMRDLLDPKKTPRVPKAVRRRALMVLRHYPSNLYVDMASKLAPEIFGNRKDNP